MVKLTVSELSLEDLKSFIQLEEGKIADYEWTQAESLLLTAREEIQLQEIKSHLLNHDTTLMNEATIWARAIYPILLLAERQEIEAWAQVSLQAKYQKFELEGIADGVLGKSVAGRIEAPYLVVVEAKKGIEAKNPIFQLYGELLAAAYLNWKNNQSFKQEIFGSYTIADTWKFVRAEVEGIDAETPTMRVEYSREYVEKLEAETIFKILKKIVSKYFN
jgi:hypothetical protein